MTLATLGKYELKREIGHGGMGVVYEAINSNIDRRVAIKLLQHRFLRSGDQLARFLNEAKAANLVSHPGIVQITDYDWAENGQGYIVMEFLEGSTLAARLKARSAPLSTVEALRFGRMLAGALSSVHAAGIVHRDLKPDNVMLIPDQDVPGGERTKIMDFGIAKFRESLQLDADLDGGPTQLQTRGGVRLGTPKYMSPEQCDAVHTVGDRSDVYSLGIMLYEMLAGEVPFWGEQIIARHMLEAPRFLGTIAPGVPPRLCQLVHEMLAKRPEERPCMREVDQRLLQLMADQQVDSLGMSSLPPANPSRSTPESHQGASATLSQSDTAPLPTGPTTLEHTATLQPAGLLHRPPLTGPQKRIYWVLPLALLSPCEPLRCSSLPRVAELHPAAVTEPVRPQSREGLFPVPGFITEPSMKQIDSPSPSRAGMRTPPTPVSADRREPARAKPPVRRVPGRAPERHPADKSLAEHIEEL